MNILGLTDIHGHVKALQDMNDMILAADLILLVGDITNFGRQAEIESILSALEPHGEKVLAVSGNCDYPEVDVCLTDRNLNLHATSVVVDGIGFLGLGGSLITPFGTPNEMSEDEIESCLDRAYARIEPDTPFVLVSHQPPHGTRCDRLASGMHVGSRSVRNFIEKRRPLACFTGHIHESVGTDWIGATPIINPGPLGRGFYAFAEISRQSAKLEIRPI
jgi:uncharacterized protein